MAPRRGGGVTIVGGGGDGSDVDPAYLNTIFSYVTLGVYIIYFLYIIMVILAQKQHFPYIFMYAIISCSLLNSILTVLVNATDYGGFPAIAAANVYASVTRILSWLFLYEPSRQISNLKRAASITTNAGQSVVGNHNERISIWNLAQYTASPQATVVLVGYFIGFILVIISIVSNVLRVYGFAGVGNLVFVNVLGPWAFVLLWFFLAGSHWQYIGDKTSYSLYAFFNVCIQVGSTILMLNVFTEALAPVICGFVLVDICHFAAVFYGIVHGSKWVASSQYSFITSQK